MLNACSVQTALEFVDSTYPVNSFLKEPRHDIFNHFFDGLNYGVGKLKNNGLLRKKNTKGVILKQKRTRMENIETD